MFEYSITHLKRRESYISRPNHYTLSFQVPDTVKSIILEKLSSSSCDDEGDHKALSTSQVQQIQLIKDFWDWWSDHKLSIATDIALKQLDSKLMTELSHRVSRIHPDLAMFQFSYGINGSLYSLVFCGASDPKLRLLQEMVVLFAPAPCYHFCYFSCLQPYVRDVEDMIYYAQNVRLQVKDVRWRVKVRSKRRLIDIHEIIMPVSSRYTKHDEISVIFHLLDNMLGEDAVESYIGKVNHRITYVDSISDLVVVTSDDDILSSRQLVELVAELHNSYEEDLYQVSKITMSTTNSDNNSSDDAVLLGYHNWNAGLKRNYFLFHSLYCSLVFSRRDSTGPSFNFSMIEELRSRFPEGTLAILSWSTILHCGSCELYIMDTPKLRRTIRDYVSEYKRQGWNISVELLVDPYWRNQSSKRAQRKLKQIQGYLKPIMTSGSTDSIDNVDCESEKGACTKQLSSVKSKKASHGPSPQDKSSCVNICSSCKKTFFVSDTCPFCRLNKNTMIY